MAGRPPHALTVDLIYAEIRQGSRTTINDELKLWKDEQVKVDALSAALPPVVANAMMSIWAVAVEHGEKVFEQRRDEIENELVVALQRVQTLETDLVRERDGAAGLQAQLSSRQAQAEALRDEMVRMRAAVEAAQAHAQTLEQQVVSLRAEAEQRLAVTITDLQQTTAAQEQAFRAEIDKATQRLEGVQKHVMLQVADAREATKRVETLLAKAQLKNEELSDEAQQLKVQLSAQIQLNEKAQDDLTRVTQAAQELRVERETLIQQIAISTGKIEAQTGQIESMEHRAIGAETRLEEALKRSTTSKKKRDK